MPGQKHPDPESVNRQLGADFFLQLQPPEYDESKFLSLALGDTENSRPAARHAASLFNDSSS